jgi:hypothetical protein
MKIKEGIAASPDGAGIEEAAKLAVPEKEADTRYAGMAEYLFLRVEIELTIKTIQFRQGKKRGQGDGDPPADIPELAPFFSDDPVQDQSAADRQQYKGALGHQRSCRQQGARQEVEPGAVDRSAGGRPAGIRDTL